MPSSSSRRSSGRRSGPKVSRRPHVLVLGASRTAAAISDALSHRSVDARLRSSPRENDEATTDTTRAVFVVPPIAAISAADYAASYRERHPHIPLYVAMRGPLPPRALKKLYERGVQAVFEWPRDKEPLLRTAFRLAGSVPLDRGQVTPEDVALEELVNGHLRTAPVRLPKQLVARVRHRYAILGGVVDALWKVHVAERIASQVAGVEDVVSVSVDVNGPEKSDRAISTAVRQVLKHAIDVDASTLACRVDEGVVTLSGLAVDLAELNRVLRLIEHVRGVRRVKNFATVSSEGKARDRTVAGRVQRAIEVHHPKAKVDVAVFGGVAVLSGRVRLAGTRVALIELVEGQEGVRRVVDKVRVSRRR